MGGRADGREKEYRLPEQQGKAAAAATAAVAAAAILQSADI